MAHKILFTEDAIADLEIILDYIRADNPSAAERFGTALLSHVEMLQNFPRLGVPVPRRPSVHNILHSPVLVYYRWDGADAASCSGLDGETLIRHD